MWLQTHTHSKECKETPVTWAEPLEQSDPLPHRAVTSPLSVWDSPGESAAEYRQITLQTEGECCLQTLGLSMGCWDSRKSYYRAFRGRTRSNKEREKIQLEGKRVANEIKEASCTWTGWLSTHLSALHHSLSCLLINLWSWQFSRVKGSVFRVTVYRDCKSLKKGSEITGAVCLECQHPETPDFRLVVAGVCMSACGH